MRNLPKVGDLFTVDRDLYTFQEHRISSLGSHMPGIKAMVLVPSGGAALFLRSADTTGAIFEFLVDGYPRILSYSDLDRLTFVGGTHYPHSGTLLESQVTCRLLSDRGTVGLVMEPGDRCAYVDQANVAQTSTTHRLENNSQHFFLCVSDEDFDSTFQPVSGAHNG